MNQPENYLHTTHRTISWFLKADQRQELELSAPFQRNPVWTVHQKAFLIDTVLQGFPIPELYMVDQVDAAGNEIHTVVDGQQRIRACLDFVEGKYKLQGDEIQPRWKSRLFEELDPTEKQTIFGYKFVVRVLPNMSEPELRKIFARLNRNVVALNEQELRNATYWGDFIRTVQSMADDDEFWSEFGIFTANDHRRMIDHEYISELVIAHLHGPQNKKDKLDDYYRIYEESFESKDDVIKQFRATTGEIRQLIQGSPSRWRKKSDFYTLFLTLVEYASEFPWSSNDRDKYGHAIQKFGDEVTRILAIDEAAWEAANENVKQYARAVSRAASDRQNRVARKDAFKKATGLVDRPVPV